MFFHFVKKGDTVSRLSRQYNVPMNRIIADNNLEEPYSLVVGECLIIRPKTRVYIVKPGDTIDKIAEKFSIPGEQLIKDNSISDPTRIQIGTRLVLNYDNSDKKAINARRILLSGDHQFDAEQRTAFAQLRFPVCLPDRKRRQSDRFGRFAHYTESK